VLLGRQGGVQQLLPVTVAAVHSPAAQELLSELFKLLQVDTQQGTLLQHLQVMAGVNPSSSSSSALAAAAAAAAVALYQQQQQQQQQQQHCGSSHQQHRTEPTHAAELQHLQQDLFKPQQRTGPINTDWWQDERVLFFVSFFVLFSVLFVLCLFAVRWYLCVCTSVFVSVCVRLPCSLPGR